MTTRELIDTFTREEGIALFNTKKTDKEIYDLFVSKGLTDSFETFVDESKKIFNEKFSKMSQEEIIKQIDGAELTDEQLEMIAGGKDGEDKEAAEISGISAAIVVVSIGAAAGAI